MSRRFFHLLWFLVPALAFGGALALYRNDWNQLTVLGLFSALWLPALAATALGAVLFALRRLLYKKTGAPWLAPVCYLCLFALSTALFLPAAVAAVGVPGEWYSAEVIMDPTGVAPAVTPPAAAMALFCASALCLLFCLFELALPPILKKLQKRNRP